jgi:hypothetical protein
MANGKSPAIGAELNIPTYLPLRTAAQKYGLSEKVLTQLVQTGKIEAVKLPSGELLVSAENGQLRTKDEIIAQEFAHLRGQAISASEASRKYSKKYGIPIPYQNFSRWADSGYIAIKSRGYRLQLDEADVAYCAEIYAEKYKEYDGQMQGVPVFDEDGNPYQVKHQEVAEQKRTERRQLKELTQNGA